MSCRLGVGADGSCCPHYLTSNAATKQLPTQSSNKQAVISEDRRCFYSLDLIDTLTQRIQQWPRQSSFQALSSRIQLVRGLFSSQVSKQFRVCQLNWCNPPNSILCISIATSVYPFPLVAWRILLSVCSIQSADVYNCVSIVCTHSAFIYMMRMRSHISNPSQAKAYSLLILMRVLVTL